MAIAVGVCILVTVVAWWGGSRLLTVGRWQVRFPRVALAAWHAALGIGVLAVAASIAAAVTATLSAQHTPNAAVGIAHTVAGWCALGALGAALVIIGVRSDEIVGAGSRTFGNVLALPHTSERLDRRTILLTCRSDEPFACAIPGRDAAVVVSTGLRAILTPAQLRAVVAHERAHLRGRHYLALQLAELDRACLPSSLAGKQLLRATTLLVELIADDDAARRAGAVHLANALVHVARHTQDVTLELRAERLTDREWSPARKLTRADAIFQA
ncbi:M56 family metallopeptidase [Microbacterium sp. LRZ72]|uniref:M56 family metallopeptidase n=1 Tax=Microbacterium sp. LRZ72 TaxID=2942481 RepID=UPI0029B10F05|nr:M56 family metallopeptidase [Microbacterium sp. LRZ72]MDX2377594.1 M56 family metallopeptidase [Microbacterium sp. LRZ72]